MEEGGLTYDAQMDKDIPATYGQDVKLLIQGCLNEDQKKRFKIEQVMKI